MKKYLSLLFVMMALVSFNANADLYMLGNKTNWSTSNPTQMELVAGSTHQYTVTLELDATEYFSFATKTASDWNGLTDNDRLVPTSKSDTDVVLDTEMGMTNGSSGAFKLANANGKYVFTVDTEAKTVKVTQETQGTPKDPELYIAGTFTDWGTNMRAMTPDANGGFSITVTGLADGAQFKFVDENGNWYGGAGDAKVNKDNCTDIQLIDGNNFVIETEEESVDLTFTVNNEKKLTVTGWPEPAPVEVKVYALMNDAEGNWNYATGVELAKDATDNHYRGLVTLVGIAPAEAPMLAPADSKAYLGFTTKLGDSWDAIADGRFGPVSNGNFEWQDGYFDQPIDLTEVGQGDKFIEIAPGKYNLDIDLESKKLVLSDANPTAVKDVNATKVVANVKYVNMAGMQADEAFEGVNVMVITYQDGTKKAVKVVK